MVITEEELKKYYNYVLDIYNKSKNDLGEILNGNSRSKENRRNNKISILLKTNNESYINAVAEAKIITDEAILKLDKLFSEFKLDGSIQQEELESLSGEVNTFMKYIDYLDNRLSEMNE